MASLDSVLPLEVNTPLEIISHPPGFVFSACKQEARRPCASGALCSLRLAELCPYEGPSRIPTVTVAWGTLHSRAAVRVH